MELREALRTHSPSLLLQRAAADEIAKLDKAKARLMGYLESAHDERDRLDARIAELEAQLAATQEPRMNVKLPERAYIDNSHDKSPGAAPVIAVKRGERGFWPIFTQQTADELNEAEGVTPAQREAMHIGSMFGWDAPGADPDHPIVQRTVKENAT